MLKWECENGIYFTTLTDTFVDQIYLGVSFYHKTNWDYKKVFTIDVN